MKRIPFKVGWLAVCVSSTVLSGGLGKSVSSSPARLELSIPSRVVLEQGVEKLLEVKVVGREKRGGILTTSPCDIGYRIYETGPAREVLKYPAKGAICPQNLILINTGEGQVNVFRSALPRNKLKAGTYTLRAIIIPLSGKGPLTQLPPILSNISVITVH